MLTSFSLTGTTVKCVIHCHCKFPSGLCSSFHSGNLLDYRLYWLASFPRLTLLSPTICSSISSQINYLHLNPCLFVSRCASAKKQIKTPLIQCEYNSHTLFITLKHHCTETHQTQVCLYHFTLSLRYTIR